MAIEECSHGAKLSTFYTPGLAYPQLCNGKMATALKKWCDEHGWQCEVEHDVSFCINTEAPPE